MIGMAGKIQQMAKKIPMNIHSLTCTAQLLYAAAHPVLYPLMLRGTRLFVIDVAYWWLIVARALESQQARIARLHYKPKIGKADAIVARGLRKQNSAMRGVCCRIYS